MEKQKKQLFLGWYTYVNDTCPRRYNVAQLLTVAETRERALVMFRSHIRSRSDYISLMGIAAELVPEPKLRIPENDNVPPFVLATLLLRYSPVWVDPEGKVIPSEAEDVANRATELIRQE